MTATECPTCPGPGDPANFGGLCTPCETDRRARTERNRRTLAEIGDRSPFARAIGGAR